MTNKKVQYQFETYVLKPEVHAKQYPHLLAATENEPRHYAQKYLYVAVSGKNLFVRESTDIQYGSVEDLSKLCDKYLSDDYVKPYYTIESYEEYGTICISAEMHAYRKVTNEEADELKVLREEKKRESLELKDQQRENALEQARKLLREAGELP